jgi:hypothetical protein
MCDATTTMLSQNLIKDARSLSSSRFSEFWHRAFDFFFLSVARAHASERATWEMTTGIRAKDAHFGACVGE